MTLPTPASDSAPAEFARPPKSRFAPLWRSVAVSVACVVALLSFVRLDLAECGEMFARVDISLVATMIVVCLAMYVMRAVRMRIVLPVRVGIARLLGAAMVHQFYATFLPMKVGELALPMLLKADGIRRAQTLGILLVMRVLDLAVMAVALGVALFAFRDKLPAALSALWPVQVVALLASAACIVVLLRGPRATLGALVHLGRWRHGAEREPGWLAGRIDDLDQAVRTLSWQKLLLGVTTTVGIVLLALFYDVMFCQRVLPQIPLTSLVVVCLAMPLVGQIPIQGFAGIGSTEAIILAVFTLAGLSKSDALSFGIVGHVMQLAFVIGLGLLGMLIRRIGEPQRGLGDSQPKALTSSTSNEALRA